MDIGGGEAREAREARGINSGSGRKKRRGWNGEEEEVRTPKIVGRLSELQSSSEA